MLSMPFLVFLFQILFYVGASEVTSSLSETTAKMLVDQERALPVVYKPQAVFRVRPVRRCCSSMPGHTQPVVSALFSADGARLATAAGDCTVPNILQQIISHLRTLSCLGSPLGPDDGDPPARAGRRRGGGALEIRPGAGVGARRHGQTGMLLAKFKCKWNFPT